MLDLIKRFVREDEGATMVEYGLMVALIAVVLIVTVSILGQDLKESFARTSSGVQAANAADATQGTSANPITLP